MSRSFTGSTSDYLENASALAGPQNFCVSGWCKLNSVAGNNTLFGLFNASDRYNQVVCITTQVWAYSYDGTTFPSAQSAATLTTGVWFHWAANFSTTTSRSIFLNGTKTTDTNGCSPTGMNRTTLGCYRGGSPAQPLDGCLAHVGLWSTILGDDEIQNGLAKGLSPQKVRPAALVDYWPLITGSGNENGICGNVLTKTGTVGNSADNPRIYL